MWESEAVVGVGVGGKGGFRTWGFARRARKVSDGFLESVLAMWVARSDSVWM